MGGGGGGVGVNISPGTLGAGSSYVPVQVETVLSGGDDEIMEDAAPPLAAVRFNTGGSLGGSYGAFHTQEGSLAGSAAMAVPKGKFGITLVPSDPLIFQQLCRKQIGSSGTVCLQKNCTVRHQGDRVDSIKINSILISRDTGKAFRAPALSIDRVESELIGEMLSMQHPYSEWQIRFDLIEEIYEESTVKVSSAELDIALDNQAKLLAYRTPKKARREPPMDDVLEEETKESREYVPVFDVDKFDEAPADGDVSGAKLGRLASMIAEMDRAMIKFRGDLNITGVRLTEVSEGASKSSLSLETRLRDINNGLGQRPSTLRGPIVPSTVWNAIAGLSEHVDGLSAGHSNGSVTGPSPLSHLAGKVDAINRDMLKGVGAMMGQLVEVKTRLAEVEEGPGANPFGARSSGPDVTADYSTLLRTVEGLQNKLAAISNNAQDSMVTFGGVNLDTFSKASAYVGQVFPDGNVSLLLTPHILLHHVYEIEETGLDVVSQMAKLSKANLKDAWMGTAYSATGHPLPLSLGTSKSGVVKAEQSYLSKITTYESYIHADTGKRDTIKDHMSTVRNAVKEAIAEEYESESRASMLATLALEASYSFVNDIFNFIDAYMEHLTQAKFSRARAFHVTTRLVKRLFLDIFKPCQGISNSLKVGDPVGSARILFWANIRSLHIAQGIQKIGIENHHLVASELVKFLTVNTGIDGIEKLQTKFEKLEETFAKIKPAALDAQSSEKSNANRIKALEDKLSALVQKVNKLPGRAAANGA